MRYLAAGLLCTLAWSAQATTLDYAVSKDPNGFNVYKVTKDAVTKVTGSPFGSSLVRYVWTDSTYIYVVNLDPRPPTPYYGGQLLTYQMVNGIPKQVASLPDDALVPTPSGSSFVTITSMVSSPQHLFIPYVERGGNQLRIYHKHSGGSLSEMCNLYFVPSPYSSESASAILAVRTDANDFYAYVDYIDPATYATVTGIYDISTSACKQVGKLPQS